MPRLGPEYFIATEKMTFFGQTGPALDCDLHNLDLYPGTQASVEIRVEDGCAVVSTGQNAVFVPLPQQTINTLSKLYLKT